MAQSSSITNQGTNKATSAFKFFPTLFPKSFIELTKRRIKELVGVILILLGITFVISVLSYHPSDPSLNSAASGPAKNMLGLAGSYLADLVLQVFGVVALLPSLVFYAWGWRVLNKKLIHFIWLRALALITGLILASMALSVITPPEAWPLRSGIGGVAGQTLFHQTITAMEPLHFLYGNVFVVILSSVLSITILIYAGGLDRSEWSALRRGAIKLSISIWRSVTSLSRQETSLKERTEPTFGINERDNDGTIKTFDAKLSSNNTLNSSYKITKPTKVAVAEKTK
jgi:S-DNA-T family DNA segregation ATPase FtsK/SpoIIIE